MDDTTLCNMALSSIGTRSMLVNLQEDSPEAQQCTLWYEQTRNELLRKYPWDWARRQNYLAVLKAAAGTPENPTGSGNTPPLPWLYSYAYPTDCADARYILPLAVPLTTDAVPLTTGQLTAAVSPISPTIRFLVVGDQDANGNPIKTIVTNQAQAILVYTGYVTDPNVWDDNFITALVGRLAPKLVIPLAGDKTLAKMAMEAGQRAEAEAEMTNGNEGTTYVDVTPDWLTQRGFDDPEGSNLYIGGGVLSDIA